MRLRTSIVLIIGLAAAVTLFLVRAHARQRPEVKTIVITQKTPTSTFFLAAFNFDPSKGDANMAIYRGEGSMGNFTGEGVSQSRFSKEEVSKAVRFQMAPPEYN